MKLMRSKDRLNVWNVNGKYMAEIGPYDVKIGFSPKSNDGWVKILSSDEDLLDILDKKSIPYKSVDGEPWIGIPKSFLNIQNNVNEANRHN